VIKFPTFDKSPNKLSKNSSHVHGAYPYALDLFFVLKDGRDRNVVLAQDRQKRILGMRLP
jgi:hypothetical protein